MAKSKKENLIIVFYVLYFSWLMVIAFLNPDPVYLNYVTAFIVVFYLIFLRKKGDFRWFLAGVTLSLILLSVSLNGWKIDFNFQTIKITPIWISLAWGITFSALRKFYLILTN